VRIDIPSILVHLRAAQWCQETWDVNDSVLIADPKTDAEVGEFFSRLPDGDYLPTWHTQRQPGSAVDADEQAAATKAAAHADTTNRACDSPEIPGAKINIGPMLDKGLSLCR
jgi:hypothetical protein